MICKFSPMTEAQADEVAALLQTITGDLCRVVRLYRQDKFRIERFTGSEWVKA